MERNPFRTLAVMACWCWLCLMVFLASCVSGEVQMQADEAAPGCVMASVQDPLRGTATLATYAGRTFLVDGNHLGWDILLPEGQAVYPIGCGTVRLARAARGYGMLVVVIEHRLAAGFSVRNGVGERVFVDRFLSIYGHLRPTSERNGRGTSRAVQVGDVISPTTIIGYVENGATNGDGAEHLHLGIRLQSAAEAMETDPVAWFRGYDSSPSRARWFVNPQTFLEQLRMKFIQPTSVDAGSVMDIGFDRMEPAGVVMTTDASLPMDLQVLRDSGAVMPSSVVDAGVIARDLGSPVVDIPPLPPLDVGRDVPLLPDIPRLEPEVFVPPPPSRIRYEFRVRSALRVTPPYRLRNQWWGSMRCENTASIDPIVMPDGFARCETDRLAIFDGSVFLPDHPDWGDNGQIGTVANVPERCTPVQGAEWRITDLGTNRILFSGPASGLRCVSLGSQDRWQLP